MIVNSFKEPPAHAPLVLSNSYNRRCVDSGNTGFPFDLFNEKSEFHFLISSMFYVPDSYLIPDMFQVLIIHVLCSRLSSSRFYISRFSSSMFYVPGSHPGSIFQVPFSPMFCVPGSLLINVLFYVPGSQVLFSSMFCVPGSHHPCSMFQVLIIHVLCSRFPSYPGSMFQILISSMFYVPGSHLIHVLCSRFPSHS